MTDLERIREFRSKIQYAKKYMIIYGGDEGLDKRLDSDWGFFVWDDSKELLHVLINNGDIATDIYNYPIKIISIPYSVIGFLDTIHI